MRYLAVLSALFLLLPAALSPVAAQPNRAREGVQSGQMRSLDQILSDIRRNRAGNLSDVQGPFGGANGEPHYRLKWLTPDGRVQWLDTDARTGRVLGVEGGEGPRGNFPAPRFQNQNQNPNPNFGRGAGPEPQNQGYGGARGRFEDFPPNRGRGQAPGRGQDRGPRGNRFGR